MKRINSFFSVILLAALMFSSCQDRDVFDSASVHQPSGEQVKLHLGLNIQSNFQSGLRAITKAAEDSIGHIDVLVFEETAPKVLTYSYRKTANLRDTTVVVETNYDLGQQLVVITNAEEAIKKLFINDEGTEINRVGMSKEELLRLLTFSFSSDGEKWDATDTNNYTKFPMWGESAPDIITKDTDGDIDIKLMRMVARIDVTNNADKFTIENLYLYNTNTTGFIVPYSKASMPTYKGPIEYEKGDSIRSIYTFETAAPPTDATLATCLVIAGRYNNEAQTSYYRVDFLKLDAAGKKTLFADIERNHWYTVNIIGVKARGYDTREEAFSAKSLNIEAGVEDWTEASDDVAADGQYFLKVSADAPLKFEDGTLKFSRESSTGKLTVETDLLAGWTASVSGDGGLTLDNTEGASPHSSLSFKVVGYKQSDPTNPADIRTNTITVFAGRLKREIIIKQANVDPITLTFSTLVGNPDSDGNIIITVDAFGIIQTNNNTLTVAWTPKTHNFHLWNAPAGSSFAGSLILSSMFYTRGPSNPDLNLDITKDPGAGGYQNDAGLKITGQATNGFQTIEKSIVLKIKR